MMNVYRIEHKKTKAGMWYNYDGTYNGIIKILTEGKSKDVPMPRTKHQSKDNKKWFSSVSNLEQLLEWFTVKDIEELISMGYGLYEFQCTEYNNVADNETLFTRDGIIHKQEIDLNDFVKLLKS